MAGDLLDDLDSDGMTLPGVLATHQHPDRNGGSMMGIELEGLTDLRERVDAPVHVNSHQAEKCHPATVFRART
ncbi:hypothetical protein TUM20985_24330 [Mycobacterium antarcticum]|nr:hypothetical protein TUM20985_24330 [Mycolicibacterium sp. TUM20985]GLP75188.1 hypothetical protein TUM20983_22980 [Mycolicibacterium sp. TUM20983]GLP80961.1 hypothetical protein TUM20984_23810 [Mycolicibacterium sp. TUM20984]